jgi:hypothetical protein
MRNIAEPRLDSSDVCGPYSHLMLVVIHVVRFCIKEFWEHPSDYKNQPVDNTNRSHSHASLHKPKSEEVPSVSIRRILFLCLHDAHPTMSPAVLCLIVNLLVNIKLLKKYNNPSRQSVLAASCNPHVAICFRKKCANIIYYICICWAKCLFPEVCKNRK